MTEDKPDPWKCAACGRHWVVPTLARRCEAADARDWGIQP